MDTERFKSDCKACENIDINVVKEVFNKKKPSGHLTFCDVVV